ncbi:hypothetical protein OC861_007076, partial [Tilletia horrida]
LPPVHLLDDIQTLAQANPVVENADYAQRGMEWESQLDYGAYLDSLNADNDAEGGIDEDEDGIDVGDVDEDDNWTGNIEEDNVDIDRETDDSDTTSDDHHAI